MVRYTGAFSEVSAIDFGGARFARSGEAVGREPGRVRSRDFWHVMQTSADALYGARHVALKAGLKMETPAVTVNRLCGSGIEAIAQAAQSCSLGEAELVVAGGNGKHDAGAVCDSRIATGLKLGGGALEDTLMAGLTDTYCGLPMALTAESWRNNMELRGRTRMPMRCGASSWLMRRTRLAGFVKSLCRWK